MSHRYYNDGYYQQVPDLIQQFIYSFYRHIRDRNTKEIESMYEVSFVKFSENFYKGSSWPPFESVAEFAERDHVFGLLYKELYYRHLFAQSIPTLQDRIDSFKNYSELFDLLLNNNVNMILPNKWIWDLVDEYCYQFQNWGQYRCKPANMNDEDLERMKSCKDIWAVETVATTLQRLVDRSGIVKELEEDGGVKLYSYNGLYPNQSNVLRLVGYFSLLGLLRVRCLVGDYQAALKAIYPINLFDQKNLFATRIIGAAICLYFYSGFAYLMQRRYLDAVRCFNYISLHIYRVKNHYMHSNQLEVLRMNERHYALLALAVALCPASAKFLDETVQLQLNDRQEDHIATMCRGGLSAEKVLETLFSEAGPKFVTLQAPNYTRPSVNSNDQAFRGQLAAFMEEARIALALPTLKQFLRLYSSVTLTKLANLLEMEPAVLRAALLKRIERNVQIRHNGSNLDMTYGEEVKATDLDFTLEKNAETGEEMVIAQVAPANVSFVPLLKHHINRFQNILKDLDNSTIAA
uniref:Eukaryotic translation initiation factor 3 subunit L n=1 Tax=Polytomella parva TaxID=51329 RepID=A0A7S0Y9T6_9CHLO|mmetsp:Transcript_11708/g.21047  ORF Transcript_11708/g.21047 Transcript_11708/m.21047 type:complete len:520 (+) Transcript_11708:70-1629(+)|eukprot:CAMPEP_0175042278 /NCGR_PEP_ID=MMETSP0052_2-20121109/2462_1 /TAXON_ID=51329 ORGANISM="Polytomella parva, Strain SAG 63-3" /NCGR_SAMPLE_ID=MMETSP0052_2 /ASSEMBLY_ACC=CAM_ASM_000194 /LENGTH=519 /DNA_ID=CAMNT_0016305047 /DNA_START=31 /DNA_END=1590 /DNA_ORIENTATION=+